MREIREHGVEKIYHLLPEPLQTDCDTIIYIYVGFALVVDVQVD